MCECGQPPFGASSKCRRCYYLAVLGLGREATDAEIKSTYRRLIRECHPDTLHRNSDKARAASERASELNVAHEVLIKGAKGNTPRPVRGPDSRASTAPPRQPPPPPGNKGQAEQHTRSGYRPPPGQGSAGTASGVPPQDRQRRSAGTGTNPQPASASEQPPEPWRPDYTPPPPAEPVVVPVPRSSGSWRAVASILVLIAFLSGGSRLLPLLVSGVFRNLPQTPTPPAVSDFSVCTADRTPDACGCITSGGFRAGEPMKIVVSVSSRETVRLVLPDRVLNLPDAAHGWRTGHYHSCVVVPYRMPVAGSAYSATLNWQQDGRTDSRRIEFPARQAVARGAP